MIEVMSTPKATYIRLEFHLALSEHNGSKQRYQVKYCAVMTLLNATKANVWQNNAKLKSYGAIPKLEKPSIRTCGMRGI